MPCKTPRFCRHAVWAAQQLATLQRAIMNVTAYLTVLLSVAGLSACKTAPSPLQNISDARSALAEADKSFKRCDCDKQAVTPRPLGCDCAALHAAHDKVRRAEQLLSNGDDYNASKEAYSAFIQSQNLLRGRLFNDADD